MYNFLQAYNLFYNSQHGFWIEHSSKFAAFVVIDRIMVEMVKKEILINIYLDLLKAFDILDHNISIDKHISLIKKQLKYIM